MYYFISEINTSPEVNEQASATRHEIMSIISQQNIDPITTGDLSNLGRSAFKSYYRHLNDNYIQSKLKTGLIMVSPQ